MKCCNVEFSTNIVRSLFKNSSTFHTWVILCNVLKLREVTPDFLEGCSEFEAIAELDHCRRVNIYNEEVEKFLLKK